MANGANGVVIENLDEVKDKLSRSEKLSGEDLKLSERPKRSFALKSGVVLELRPVNPVVARRIEKNTFGKPQVPVVKSAVGPKKQVVEEPNPDDPDYKAELARWNEDHNERLLIYLFSHGIASEPAAEELDELSTYLPGETEDQLKYAWVMQLIGEDADDIERLSYAIMGQTMPTEKGIGEAEARFQRDGEREADSGLPAAEV